MEFFFHLFLLLWRLTSRQEVALLIPKILEFNSKSAPLAMTLMPNVDNLTQLTLILQYWDAINNANPGDILPTQRWLLLRKMW